MAHEVEASHQQDKVDEQQPVPPESHFALAQEGLGDAAPGFLSRSPHGLACLVDMCLGEHQAIQDDEDRRARAEPVQRSPAVGGRVDESAGERGGEQIAKGIALL